MYCIPLESYKDKLSNKLDFVGMILDSLKVISEKPQVNQVVPYKLNQYLCKDPSLWKEDKAISRAEDDAKSAEVGTCKVGYQSNLSSGQSSTRVGKFWKTKCDIMLKLV